MTDREQIQIDEWTDQRAFMLAGNATFTVVSTGTEKRYTFKIQKPKPRTKGEDVSDRWFVKLLSGSDNTSDYQYLGMIVAKDGQLSYIVTRAARLAADTVPQVTARWIVAHLSADKPFPGELEFYHMGSCGMCGRALTVPESIRSGLGPVCAGKV